MVSLFFLCFLYFRHAISTIHWDNIWISRVACPGDKTNSFHESVTCSSISESYYCTHHMGHLYMAKMRSISLKNGFPPPFFASLTEPQRPANPLLAGGKWQCVGFLVFDLEQNGWCSNLNTPRLQAASSESYVGSWRISCFPRISAN